MSKVRIRCLRVLITKQIIPIWSIKAHNLIIRKIKKVLDIIIILVMRKGTFTDWINLSMSTSSKRRVTTI
jgi:fucose 4-O-acetylase-like acetyltransferase